MGDWFRRFLAMPDRQRARILLQILAIFVVAVLYGLGGLSFYLRSRYLDLTPTPARARPPSTLDVDSDAMIATAAPPSPTPTSVAPSPTSVPPTAVQTVAPTPTLYPTITPAENRQALLVSDQHATGS